MKNNTGWVKLHRKLKDSSFKTKPNVIALWVEILISANHTSRKIIWNGQELEIKSGQLLTGIKKLVQHTGLTVQMIRTALTTLKSTGTITIKTYSKFSIITVNNWDKYQSTNRVINKQLTNKQQTTNKQTNYKQECINKNDKNIKRVIEKVYQPPNLTDKELEEIAEKYNTTMRFVQFQYDKMITWAESRPNNPKLIGRNWKMTLMSFVRDDMLKIKQEYGKQNSEVSI